MFAIRLFEPSDYAGVLGIERAVFSDREAEEYLAYYMMQREHFFVAQSDDELVGYAVGYVSRDIGKVFSIAVRPTFQRRGVGKTLLVRLLKSLLDAGADTVLLEVRLSNRAAQGLYRSVGFVRVSTVPMYYPDGEGAYLYLFASPAKGQMIKHGESSS